MKQSKSIGQFVSGLSATLATAFPNAQSDWIRYGLPAVVLTVIFFFAIRFESNNTEPPSQKPSIVAREAGSAGPPSRMTGFSGAQSVPENRADISNGNPVQGAPMIGHPIVPLPPPRVAASSQLQVDGRRALCGAVQYVLARVRRKHWKTNAMAMAIQTYRGASGDSPAAAAAINSALIEYGQGKWDETQCPPGGGAALAKGAIGTVMR